MFAVKQNVEREQMLEGKGRKWVGSDFKYLLKNASGGQGDYRSEAGSCRGDVAAKCSHSS